MHTAILALFLALLVPQAIAQSVSFLPPSNSSSNITFPQATHYDLYKNSGFTPNCSFPFTKSPNHNSNSSKVRTTHVHSQSEFCAKLNPEVPWFVWPTTPTPAAYLPNWLGALLSLVVLFLKALRGLFQIRRLLKREPPFGKLDVAILVYDVGQLIIWWYCAISGFLRPLHANWVNPIQWLTPSSYAFFLWAHIRAKKDKGTPVRGALRVALSACIALAATNYVTGLVYVSRRFKVDLGAGSYTPLDPFPELPAGTTSTCRDLLHNPASPLYSDPNWSSGRLTQVVMASATTLVAIAWVPVLILALCFPLNVKRATALVTYGWGIAVQFIIFLWLSLIDARGVPLMLHEGCGVVVIAMSSARGYYDSKLHYEGFQLQTAREAFGMCESLLSKPIISPELTAHDLRGVYMPEPCCVGRLYWHSFLDSLTSFC